MKTIRKTLSLALAILFLFAGCSEATQPAESPASEPVNAPQPEEIVPEEEVSRYASTSKGISSENSFLHDNVD